MAIVTGLTVADLNTQATADTNIGKSVISTVNGTLDLLALTGLTSLSDTDNIASLVIFNLNKLFANTQTFLNETVATDDTETLKSFAIPTLSIPDENFNIEVTLAQTVNLPVGTAATGVN